MKNTKNKKLFMMFLSLLCSFVLVVAMPLEAAAYQEDYSYTSGYNNYPFTCTASCTEFAGTASTTYTLPADLRLKIIGYYMYVDDEGEEIKEYRPFESIKYSVTTVSARVTPATFRSGICSQGLCAMCKIKVIHYINGTIVYQDTAQFQAW